MFKRFIKELPHRPVALISCVTLVILYITMIFAEFIAPHTPTQSYSDYSYHPPNFLLYSNKLGLRPQIQKYAVLNTITWEYAPIRDEYVPLQFFVKGEPYRLFGLIPMERHLIGTTSYPLYISGADNLGRDLFSRMVYGSRVSLTIGFIGITIAMILAVLFGGLAGFYGGFIDWIIMRFSEFFILIPGLYLILLLRSILSRNIDSAQAFMMITVILAFVGWPNDARLIRGLTHSIKREDFIQNAILEGIPSLVIIYKHILPQISSLIIVSISLGIPGFILGETVLSYLNLGISDPAVSWGSLINREISTVSNLTNYPWFLSPAVLLLITTLSFNFLGDLLRDIFDPYYSLRGKH